MTLGTRVSSLVSTKKTGTFIPTLVCGEAFIDFKQFNLFFNHRIESFPLTSQQIIKCNNYKTFILYTLSLKILCYDLI